MLDLEPIRNRLSDGTPGPWRQVGNTVYIDPAHAREPRWWALPGDYETASLIANAPTDLESLLVEVEDLREERDTLQQAINNAAEALIGEGYEFSEGGVADALIPHADDRFTGPLVDISRGRMPKAT